MAKSTLEKFIRALDDDELCTARFLLDEEMAHRAFTSVWLTQVPRDTKHQAKLRHVLRTKRDFSDDDARQFISDVLAGSSIALKNLTLDTFDLLTRIPGVLMDRPQKTKGQT